MSKCRNKNNCFMYDENCKYNCFDRHSIESVLNCANYIEVETPKYDAIEVKQLTVEELREQFNELENVKPYLNSNEIMKDMINGMFAFYVDCARVNGLLKETS